jgi:mono/diheme cytochrome c family protein
MLVQALRVVIALSAFGTMAEARAEDAAARGRVLAERLCAGCHAIDGREGSTLQNSDVPSFRALAGRPHRTAERLQAFIMTPAHPMPSIPLELSEIRDLVSYIESLK